MKFIYGQEYELCTILGEYTIAGGLSDVNVQKTEAIYIGFDDNQHLFFRENNSIFIFYRPEESFIGNMVRKKTPNLGIEAYIDDEVKLSNEERIFLLNRMKHWENKVA